MNVYPSPRLRAYVTAGIVGLVVALAVGDPAPALIAAPLLVLGVVGVAGGATPDVALKVVEAPESMVEGESAKVEIDVSAEPPPALLYVDLGLENLSIEQVVGARRVGPSTLAVPMRRAVQRVELELSPKYWGRGRLGPVTAYLESPLGSFDVEYHMPESVRVSVIPSEEAVKALLAPFETNLHVGDLVSTRRGTGSEFADLRQFRIGDDPRTVNWRVSSRAQDLWVNDRHPELNGDVLLLVDAQVEAGTELEILVDRSVRMAAALLQTYGRRHHRLGLITLDGMCRWVYPGMGEVHRRRLIEQLVSVAPGEVNWQAAERAIVRAARRPALVVAITPLIDDHLAGMIHLLGRSGVDVAVVEVDVAEILAPPEGEARAMARRIWAMERDRLSDRLKAEGIAMSSWRGIDPPEVPLRNLDDWRRSWRRRLA